LGWGCYSVFSLRGRRKKRKKVEKRDFFLEAQSPDAKIGSVYLFLTLKKKGSKSKRTRDEALAGE